MLNDDEKLELVINRGRRAEQVIDDPFIREALDTIKLGFSEKWQSETNAEQREHLWRMVRTVTMFENYFKQLIVNGMTSQAMVDRINEERKVNRMTDLTNIR